MGWTSMPRPANVKDYLSGLLTWDADDVSHKCLDIAMTLNTAYAAVSDTDKETGDETVWAAIFLLKYIAGEDEYNFCYKGVSETMGIYENQCPARILSLLTATDNPVANEWRSDCRRRLERSTEVGTTIVFTSPVSFTDGYEGQRFTIEWSQGRKRRRKVLRAENGCLYRVTGLRNRADWRPVEGVTVPVVNDAQSEMLV